MYDDTDKILERDHELKLREIDLRIAKVKEGDAVVWAFVALVISSAFWISMIAIAKAVG